MKFGNKPITGIVPRSHFMFYGFLQLHKKLLDTEGVASLRRCCMDVAPRFMSDGKFGWRDVFDARTEDPAYFENLSTVLTWFRASPLPRVFQAIHGDTPALMIDFLTVRQHERGQSASHVSWHADANIAGTRGPMMICWVPLDPVGKTAPSLEFCLPRRLPALPALQSSWLSVAGRSDGGMFDDDALEEMYGEGGFDLETYALDVGDCLVFDCLTLHRTQPLLNPTTTRMALESRVVSRRRRPPDRVANRRMILCTNDGEDGRINIVTDDMLYEAA